jgi:hypothetical protein
MPLNLSKDELRYVRHLIWKDCIDTKKENPHLLRKVEKDLTVMKRKAKRNSVPLVE